MSQQKQKKEESPSFFKELGTYMKPYNGLYTSSVLVSILGVACSLGSYACVGLLAARLFVGQISTAVWVLTAAAALLRVLYGLLCNFSTWLSHKAAYMTLADVREAMSEKMLHIPLGFFESNGSGRLTTLLTDRIESIEQPLAHVLPEMTANLLAPAAMLVWMFFLDWRLALCALVWIILGLSVTGGMMKNYPEKFAGQLAAIKNMNQAITEYVSGIEVIKNFGQADSCSQKYEKAIYGHADYNVGWQKETQIYSALGMAVAPFSVFPVLIAGMIFFSRGTLQPEALILTVLLTMGIFHPLMRSMGYFDQLAQMGTTAKELNTVLSYPELHRGSGAKADEPTVEFSHVSFSYHTDSAPALSDISFFVPAGSMLALVGPSGSGKSTVAKLLAGYWDAGGGEIRLCGFPLSAYTQEQLNQLVAYVDQDTFLFDETIADNIRFGRPEATDQEVEQAAKAAGCDEFIRRLPQGYQTLAGAAGNRLSGGEKQRIAIARAMMKHAPILILDEATASADPENEALIQAALSAAAVGKTLIVVAHHLSTIIHAQQIAYIQDGRLLQIGSHQTMLAQCPEYAALWAAAKEG